MRFTIQTDIFRKAIDATSHATGSGSLTPILENLLIEATDNSVILTGNNLDMAIEYVITNGVNIEIPGKYTLPAKFLTSYISLVNDTEITVELEKTSINLTTQSGKTSVKGIEADKFPSIPNIQSDKAILMDAKEFKWAIDKTLFSTAEWSVRPMLAGILINPQEDKIIFASTDSFRLSDYHLIPKHAVSHPPIILPKKTAQEIARLANDATDDIKLFTEDSQILVEVGEIRITSRLLAGRFPEYSNFFPKEYQTRSTVLRTEFINALKQINLIVKANNNNIRIKSLSDNKIEIFTGDTELWNWQRILSGTVEWEEDTIGINGEYLLAVLMVIRDDYISFEYKNALSPIVIRWVASEEKNKEEYRHLIMPLKI